MTAATRIFSLDGHAADTFRFELLAHVSSWGSDTMVFTASCRMHVNRIPMIQTGLVPRLATYTSNAKVASQTPSSPFRSCPWCMSLHPLSPKREQQSIRIHCASTLTAGYFAHSSRPKVRSAPTPDAIQHWYKQSPHYLFTSQRSPTPHAPTSANHA